MGEHPEDSKLTIKGRTITVLAVIDSYHELNLGDWFDMLEFAGKYGARPRTFEIDGRDVVFLIKDANVFTDSEIEETVTNWYREGRG